MPVEKSAGAIVFYEENGAIKYLLLHYPQGSRNSKDYWDLPKGHIEKEEKPQDAAKREVKEETGLKKIEFIKGFEEAIEYFFKYKGKKVFKSVTFYLAKTKIREIRISDEHIGYQWLPYRESLEKLTFKNAKQILKKANNFISGKSV